MAEEFVQIRVDGLKQLNRSLKDLGADMPKALRLAGNQAADIVVAQARPKVPTGPGKGGHAASSVKAASTRTAARVKAGGAKFPYFPWLDFGGRVGRKKHVVRPFLKTGRYVWKAYSDKHEEVATVLAGALDRVIVDSGLGPVKGGE
ncbi:MAG TPA: hypothetical protein VH333_10055 [Pseudonocardiaceae bacterium]|nr:hypothetical protein [Pseudonocardiaceae bacterium]